MVDVQVGTKVGNWYGSAFGNSLFWGAAVVSSDLRFVLISLVIFLGGNRGLGVDLSEIIDIVDEVSHIVHYKLVESWQAVMIICSGSMEKNIWGIKS